MYHKYLFGSKMLKMNNCRDEDWLTFTSDNARTARENGYKSIPFYKRIVKCFTEGKNVKADPFNAMFLYQLSAPFISDPNYPFNDFNIFEHKEVWIAWLKAFVNSSNNETWATKKDILPKQFYHVLYQYYMITEDVHWISDEAKAVVQKIHDYEMPSSYFYDLRNLINSLEVKNEV